MYNFIDYLVFYKIYYTLKMLMSYIREVKKNPNDFIDEC